MSVLEFSPLNIAMLIEKIEIRKEFGANSPSELSLGIVKTERRKAARLHVARPMRIDPHQTALCIVHLAGIRSRREDTRQGHVFIRLSLTSDGVALNSADLCQGGVSH